MMLFLNSQLDFTRNIDAVEEFAGQHEVTKAQWATGKVAIPYEINMDNEMMDIMSGSGYAHALHLMVKFAPGGFKLTAPVISS
jgi:hypothetical protein